MHTPNGSPLPYTPHVARYRTSAICAQYIPQLFHYQRISLSIRYTEQVTTITLSTLNRLRIIQLAAVMMFWFGIEQLFLDNVLLDSSGRMWTTIAFSVGLLLFDIPMGILADKFGRKKSVISSFFILIASSLVLGLSTSVAMYAVGALCFGLYVSFINGASQALLYDHLKAADLTHLYAKQQGSIYACGLIGAAIANIMSGIIAADLGLRAPYLLSVIPALFALIVALGLKEAPRDQESRDIRWLSHLSEIRETIKKKPTVVIFAVLFIVAILLNVTIGEFGQIYILAFGVSTIALGIWWAIVALAAAGGYYIAHLFKHRLGTLIGLMTILFTVFTATRSQAGLVIFCLVYGIIATLYTISESNIQDATPSKIRATMISAISFVGNLLAIPVIMAFNHILLSSDIYTANTWTSIILIGILVIAIVSLKFLPALRAATPINQESNA